MQQRRLVLLGTHMSQSALVYSPTMPCNTLQCHAIQYNSRHTVDMRSQANAALPHRVTQQGLAGEVPALAHSHADDDTCK